MSGLLIHVPYFGKQSVLSHQRYHWKNWQRGKEPFVIIQWTLSGEGNFIFKGKEYGVPQNHAFIALIPERSEYFFPSGATTPWKFYWVNFYGQPALSLWREFRNRYGCMLPLHPESAAADLLLQLTTGKDREESDRYHQSRTGFSFFTEWMRTLDHPQTLSSDPVSIAVQSCRHRFREPIGVKQLAAEAGMSREHFTRIFSARMAISPAAYLRQLRMDAAKKLLYTTHLPLGEIAMRSGLSSPRALVGMRRHISKRKSGETHL